MLATYINALAVIVGSLIGLFLGSRIKDTFKTVVFISAGLVTLVIGFKMALATENFLIMIFALALGGLLGYVIRIEDRILGLGDLIERKTQKSQGEGAQEAEAQSSRFGVGFLNASLLFCSGSMSVVGSIAAGTSGNYELILIKSVMDGCMAIIFAAAYGPGVMASALVILLYQGFFTLAGSWLEPLLGTSGINELSAVGGLLLIMIGLGLLKIKEFKTGNFLPALVFAPLFAVLSPLVMGWFS